VIELVSSWLGERITSLDLETYLFAMHTLKKHSKAQEKTNKSKKITQKSKSTIQVGEDMYPT